MRPSAWKGQSEKKGVILNPTQIVHISQAWQDNQICFHLSIEAYYDSAEVRTPSEKTQKGETLMMCQKLY